MREISEPIEKELKQLEYELRYELPKEIEKATALGDLRENAEYHAALERQSYVRARIGQLKKKLGQLATIRLDQIPDDRIAFGSEVKLIDLDSDEEVTYELVFADEGDPKKGRISMTSPIGRALMGKKVGDEAIVRAPGGDREFEIVALMTLHEREAAQAKQNEPGD